MKKGRPELVRAAFSVFSADYLKSAFVSSGLFCISFTLRVPASMQPMENRQARCQLRLKPE